MITMVVRVDGDDIYRAFIEAIALARELGVYVEFEFGGVICVAGGDGIASKGVREYRRCAGRRDEGMFMACAV